MKYNIIGDSDAPIVVIDLHRDEKIKIERGSMAFLSEVSIEGKLNSNKSGIGGVLSAIGRGLTSGESMFITHATGMSDQGKLGIAPNLPGKIISLKVGGNKQYRLNTGVFLASDDSVTYVMKSQSIGRALFGGTGGFFIMETEGDGEILVSAFGDLIELEVNPSKPLTIDNMHVVAWENTLNYNLKIASGLFGFTTGEGIVNEFTGSGKVLIQTRNYYSLVQDISSKIVK